MPLSKPTDAQASERSDGSVNQTTLVAVAEALSKLRYGAVHLTVHDGKVVQLDVTERQRFT